MIDKKIKEIADYVIRHTSWRIESEDLENNLEGDPYLRVAKSAINKEVDSRLFGSAIVASLGYSYDKTYEQIFEDHKRAISYKTDSLAFELVRLKSRENSFYKHFLSAYVEGYPCNLDLKLCKLLGLENRIEKARTDFNDCYENYRKELQVHLLNIKPKENDF